MLADLAWLPAWSMASAPFPVANLPDSGRFVSELLARSLLMKWPEMDEDDDELRSLRLVPQRHVWPVPGVTGRQKLVVPGEDGLDMPEVAFALLAECNGVVPIGAATAALRADLEGAGLKDYRHVRLSPMVEYLLVNGAAYLDRDCRAA